MAASGRDLCDYDVPRDQSSPYVLSCVTYLVPDGRELRDVGWYNVSTGFGSLTLGDDSSPYLEAPVTWAWAPTAD